MSEFLKQINNITHTLKSILIMKENNHREAIWVLGFAPCWKSKRLKDLLLRKKCSSLFLSVSSEHKKSRSSSVNLQCSFSLNNFKKKPLATFCSSLIVTELTTYYHFRNEIVTRLEFGILKKIIYFLFEKEKN